MDPLLEWIPMDCLGKYSVIYVLFVVAIVVVIGFITVAASLIAIYTLLNTCLPQSKAHLLHGFRNNAGFV